MHEPIRLTRLSFLVVFTLSLLVGLVGCVTAPSPDELINPSAVPNGPPTIRTPNGSLSEKQSRAVIDRLQSQVPSTDILQRHLAQAEELTGAPLVAGNKVTLLTDGPITYAAIFQAIEAAQDHINLETYIFADDDLGERLAAALSRKQAEGVQVNIIYDAVGSLTTPETFFATLKGRGIQILKFNPVNPLENPGIRSVNQRDHRKILIVDGKVAFTGGVNITSAYSRSAFRKPKRKEVDIENSAWRDTHIRIEGPAVTGLQKLFMGTWQRQNGPALSPRNYFPALTTQGDHIARVIGSTSSDKEFDVYKILLSAIQNADNYIHITNAYFIPDKHLLTAIKQAADRGVEIKMVLPSYTDSGAVFHAGRSHYTTLLESGIKIYERRHALLHAKTMVIDGVWSTVGSANLDMRSFFHNDEVNVVILGSQFAGEMEALFQKDLQDSDEVSLEQWEQRPLWQRLKEGASRLFEYWM